METNSPSDANFLHVLQKTSILKTFSIVKTITTTQLDKLKVQAKAKSKTNAEYTVALSNLLSEYRDSQRKTEIIPGIIHDKPTMDRRVEIVNEVTKLLDTIKKGKKSKDELAFFVSSLISQLKLTKEDFKSIGETDDSEDDSDDED